MTDNLSAGPPFPHQPGEPAGAARQVAARALDVGQLGGDINRLHAPVKLNVHGALSAPVAGAATRPLQLIQRTSQSGIFAAGALQFFANAVDTYNGEIDRLNERWSSEAAGDFGVSRPYVPGGATPEQAQAAADEYAAAVEAARADLRRELRGLQRRAEAVLDDAAGESRAMLARGPNDGDADFLLSSGALLDLLHGLQSGFQGQAVPLDPSAIGLGIWGAGRGLKGLDLYTQAMRDVRFRGPNPVFGPQSVLSEGRVRPWFRSSNWSGSMTPEQAQARFDRLNRLIGHGSTALAGYVNVDRDGVTRGAVETTAGVQAAKCASGSPPKGKLSFALKAAAGVACATAGTEAARFITGLPGLKQAADLEDAATETAVDGVEYVVGKPSYGRSSPYGIPTIELSTPGIVKDAENLAGGAVETVTDVFK